MRLLKPSWVSHDGNPIFSVDIHPDGSRFATGGQGVDTGRVVIWNMAPVINEDDEHDENVPKLICQMDNHLACVNCVRWSISGKLLASGGDDKVVMIWQMGRYGNGTTGFGTNGKMANVEHWRCLASLRGHSGDVLDLAWSPHDAWLATCSVDNSVIVWNALKWHEIVAVLKGHTGLVKGVSWDPVGRYLSSQSDDKSVRVWRTQDWQCETVLTEPFKECGGTTHTLRLSWSPDGQYLVSAHAMNNSGPTAQIIERDGWKTNKDFVGHRKAITCVRFNPNILSKINKDTGKTQHFCCCAIGSRDRSLSVWLTCLKRPLVIIHDLFTNSVLDISWSQSGYQVLICSWDGTVAFFEFTLEEVGKTISVDEKNQLHQRLYGKSLGNHLTSNLNTIIENPELLKLQEHMRQEENRNDLKPASTQLNAKPVVQIKGPTDKQIETRMPDGRRRITPLFIPLLADGNDGIQPFSNRGNPMFSSSSEGKSRIVIEKRDESMGNSMSAISTHQKPNESGIISTPKTNDTAKHVEAKTIDFEKTPTVIPTNQVELMELQREPPKVQKPLTNVDSTPIYVPVKKKPEIVSLPAKLPEKKKPGRPALSQSIAPQPIPEKEKTERPTHSAGASLHLPVLRIEKNASVQVEGSGGEGSVTLEIENNIAAGPGLLVHRLKRVGAAEMGWELLLSSRGAAVAGSKHLACVVCEDSSLSVFSNTGQRLYPPIILASPPTRLTCNNRHVMVITSRGNVSVWDMQKKVATIKNESLLPVMQAGGQDLSIRSTGLTEGGHPLVSLSTGKSYIFNVDLCSWLLISSVEDVLHQCSSFSASLSRPDPENIAQWPLAALQGQTHRTTRMASTIFSANPSMQQAGTISHLDNQMAAALSLHSAKEYKFWLLALVRYLVQEVLENRLRDICEMLLGCLEGGMDSASWQPYLLGMHRHDLLKEILPIIGSNLRLQRVFTEFKDQLDQIKLL